LVEQEKWDAALGKLSRCNTVYSEMMLHAPAGPEREVYKVHTHIHTHRQRERERKRERETEAH
jgi:hypothetical protein